MMFVSRHSERSEESTDLNKEAEKLFSEHAPALLPLSSSNNISASLFRQTSNLFLPHGVGRN